MKRIITYLIEAITGGASILLLAAVGCSVWYGVAGIVLFLVLGMEANAWEGGV